jgi:hypothetical protein
MEAKYIIIVTEPAGWLIRDTPRPESQGAIRRRAEAPGAQPHAYEILPFDGVPYAYLVPQNSMKPEWARVGEAGSVIFDEDGNFVRQVAGIKSYVKVVPIVRPEENEIASALREVASAIRATKG